VEPEAPLGGVALRRHEVAPVLGNQPDARERRESGREGEVETVGDAAREERDQQRSAEVPLMDPRAQNVDPRAKPMTIDSQHRFLFGTIAPAHEVLVKNAAFVTRRLAQAIR